MATRINSSSTKSRPSSRDTQNVTIGVLPDGTGEVNALNIAPDLLESNEELTTGVKPSALPWYKRPAPAWLLFGTFLGAVAMTGTVAPRVEIYIKLACQEIRPDYDALQGDPGSVIGWPSPIGTVTIPRPSTKCQADPLVQQAVARLGATITAIMGTLSCLTSGWWGKLSDRHGRLKILALTLLGVMASDLVFITVSFASDKLPWGYRFLVVAPIMEGVLGGIATGSAATHAYLSDTTTPANRSRIFSLMLGLMFCGMALGPTLGGVLISHTGNLLSIFYVAASIHAFLLFGAIFIVPESLGKEAALRNAEQASKRSEQARLARLVHEDGDIHLQHHLSTALAKIFFFATPLSIFLPAPKGSRGRDWSLALLAVAYGVYTAIIGSYQFKFQYASYIFGWTSQQLGYWMSIIGVVRAVYLIAILPFLIKFLHPKPQESASANGSGSVASNERVRHDPAFDLVIARASLAVEVVQYTLVLLSKDVGLFLVATILSSFSGGFSPAVQSLAVELAKRQADTAAGATGENYGQLFGGLAVIQALCSQMIGPALFSAVFVGTIKDYPKGIFAAAFALVFIALLCLSLIRVPRRGVADPEREPLLSESTENTED